MDARIDRNKIIALPTGEDLRLKADLLVHGVDFSGPGVLHQLVDERKVRSGTGLYNYHRDSSGNDSRSLLPVLNVNGHTNIKSPNEIIFDGYAYDFRAEVRSNPGSPYRIEGMTGSWRLVNETASVDRPVDFPVQERWNFEIGPSRTALGSIVHPMGRNALRIYPDMTCLMDKQGIKCRFCGTLPKRRSHPDTGEPLSDPAITEEIALAVAAAQEAMPVDHVFMSTGAFYTPAATEFYAKTIAAIRAQLHNPVAEILFALTPPPADRVEQLQVLFDAGVSDLSFNLEAWDPARWSLSNTEGHLGSFKVKRGKKDHFAAFRATVAALGPGAAKSNFVAGLDEHEVLFDGFDVLLPLGVVPSATVYYPSPGAEWIEAGIDPTVTGFRDDPAGWLVELYLELAKRTRKAGLTPHWGPDNRISALEWDALVLHTGQVPASRVDQRTLELERAVA